MKIFIKAKPNAKEESVKELNDNHFLVCVKEPPIKGKANLAIVQALAKHFDITSDKVKIISGHYSRKKIVEVEQ